ncbi:MFS family permease [Sphingomonas naasensis]|uniref:MFS transporter n=1 Tax=Sphingomonas naasensis TaxID=1344951 RepID=A0A4S1WSI4_9SPHN|nr:MFS transporter [Sphingomonas naasensis]NIJ19176.1 MFS family permease [Sphingomonas naasensis]TGX46364.1 MFS transporter [Sphingomonas naasensis]
MRAVSEHRSPFHVPLFRSVWIASLASNFGGLIQSVGASWMMINLGGTPQMIALVQASTSLPIMLLSLWSGAVADNLDRRRVMLSAQFFMLIVSALLAIGTWAGMLTPWLLLVFTFLIGCGTAINGPAWQASVGDMVPRTMLPDAVAFNSMGFNVARSVGPAIGGAIVAVAGAAAAFLVNAVSYIGLIVVLARWKPELPAARLPRERIGVAMGAGIRYVALSPPIRTVLARAALFGFAASAVPAMMPLVARDIVGGGPLTFGLLLGGFGLGAVGGALGSRWMRSRLSTEALVRLASLGLAIGAAATAATGWLALSLVALAFCGAGWVLALSTFNVSVQMASPRWVVARALALYQMSAFGGMAGGSWIFGIVASGHGVEAALIAAACVQLLSVVAGLIWYLPPVSQLNLDPRDSWEEPQTAVPVEARSGPIVITIEHRIAEKDVAAFLGVMSERRRIRMRDGARHWALLRDLGDPRLWIERYHVATWLDYVRHNHRRTHADDANSEALRRLRIDGSEPVVHRRIERQTGSLPRFRGPDARELDPITDPARSN